MNLPENVIDYHTCGKIKHLPLKLREGDINNIKFEQKTELLKDDELMKSFENCLKSPSQENIEALAKKYEISNNELREGSQILKRLVPPFLLSKDNLNKSMEMTYEDKLMKDQGGSKRKMTRCQPDPAIV